MNRVDAARFGSGCCCREDRGATLVELVTTMGLTALAAASIVGLVSGSGKAVEAIAESDPLTAVAVDWLVEDLRRSAEIRVVDAEGAEVTAIDIDIPAGTATWDGRDGSLRRIAPGATTAMVVAPDVTISDSLRVSLRTTDGAMVDPDDASSVADCARVVVIEVVDHYGVGAHERVASLRGRAPEPDTC